MKTIAALALLSLGGCGSFVNLATGPQVYGGVLADVELTETRCVGSLRYVGYTDLPFSAVVDTGLLPITAIFEGLRCATGWPPRGVDP